MTEQVYDTIRLDLTPGSLWNYCPEGKGQFCVRVGPYKVIGTGEDIRTGQELILFQRRHPVGTIKNMIAPLALFEMRFEPITTPSEPVTEKPILENPAGKHQQGSGV